MDNKHQYPPGNFGLPVIGETLNFLFDHNFANKKAKKYGAVFKTSILGKKTIFMGGIEANKFILQSHFDYFSWEKGWPQNFKELLGRSLFLQDGEEHKRNRKLLMPTFHSSALHHYFETMKIIIQSYLEKWEKDKNFTWFDELKQMTFEIASVLLLGGERGENNRYLSQLFSELSAGLFTFPINLPGTSYHKALKSRDLLLSHIEKEIIKRQEKPSNDALSLLIQTKDEEGNSLKIEEIKAQAILMLFAGHETTTSMLTSFCLALSQHPEIFNKAKEEQKKLVKDGKITMDKLKLMPYLGQVLKEVERLYPPVGGGFRGVVKPFVFNGYYVPQDWQVLYRIEATHQDENIYFEPGKFDPERFNSERQEDKKAEFSLITFGGGPRFCLGYAFAQMEMKLFASLLLENYTWELESNQDLSLLNIPSLHPKSGLKVTNFCVDSMN